MDPVAALQDGRVAIALRLAAADRIAELMPGGKRSSNYAAGMPEE